MKFFLSIIVVMTFAVYGLAQQPVTEPKYDVDFSGKWRSVSVTRDTGNLPLRSDLNEDIELNITQSGHEMKLTEKTSGGRGVFSREANYFLDGRGESNKGFTEGFIYNSKTFVKKKKLRIEATLSLGNPTDTVHKTEEWELSDDGQTLTINTQSASSANRASPRNPLNSPIRHFLKFKRVN